MSERKINQTSAVNKRGEQIELKVQLTPIEGERVSEFANINDCAKYLKRKGISEAKHLSSIIYNLESAIRGYELRDIRPCNRQTAYGFVVTRQYNL